MTWTCPSKELTWQFNVNKAVGATGNIVTDVKSYLLALKASLIGFALNPWTVAMSSNATSAGASDYWSSASDLTWNASAAHSWIVLTAANGSQLCLDLKNSTSYNGIIAYSPSGAYTGGSTTARPTATDEIQLSTTFCYGTAYTGKLHVLMDSTGQHTRFMLAISSNVFTYFVISQVTAQPGFTWTPSIVAAWFSNSSTGVVAEGTCVTAYSYYTWYSGASLAMTLGIERYSTSNTSAINRTTAMTTTSAWALGVVTGMWATIGKFAIPSGASYSALPDVLIGSATNAIGSTYLNSSSERAWAQFGAIVLPWNNTICQVA